MCRDVEKLGLVARRLHVAGDWRLDQLLLPIEFAQQRLIRFTMARFVRVVP